MMGIKDFEVESSIEEFDNAVRVITNSTVTIATKNGVLVDDKELELYKGLHAVEAVTEAQELVSVRMDFPGQSESKFNLSSDMVLLTYDEYIKLIK
jgi:hypothetical protein